MYSRAHVEYAVTACSCSPSKENACAKAIHAGAKRGSMRDVLLVNRKRDVRKQGEHIWSRSVPEVGSCFLVLADAHIPYAHRIPTDCVLRLSVDKLMCQKEKLGVEVFEVIHARYM